MYNLLWIIPLVAVGIWYFVTGRQRTRKKLLEQSMSSQDWEYIEEHSRIVMKAPAAVRKKLEGIINVLIAEKSMEPCGEITEITREMQVVTMSQAALLLVGRDHHFFPRLRSVLLYPDAFTGGRDERTTRLGESWGSGSVVLSWKSVRKGGEDPKDGHNVVIHEFAHQLDQETGWGDGVPKLTERGDYADWSKAFQSAYDDFCEDVEAGRKTVLDDYGATNPAEFFAVATETFFEKASQLEEARPKIYRQLASYYGLDPAKW